MENQETDVLIIGAGIAGATAGAELAGMRRVIVLERESLPGYHSTGRSAALFTETYGNGVVRALSRASREFFYSPPTGFADYPLVRQRGVLHIARADQTAALEKVLREPDIAAVAKALGAAEALEYFPLLRPGYAAAAVYEPDAADVDVHALHQGYLKRLRAKGGRVITNAEVLGFERTGEIWNVHTTAGTFSAPIVVNAAGAWADEIARRAGIAPLGIVPCRRTALIVDPPSGIAIDDLPLTIDADELFYVKPDAGQLLMSPADETPSPPCDAQPDEMDVAIAIDRIQAAMAIDVRHVRRKWAGLRSFAPDRSLVIGYDGGAEGFFWLAAQGGYGIQTAPAAGPLAAALLMGKSVPADIEDFGIDEAAVSPRRFAGNNSL